VQTNNGATETTMPRPSPAFYNGIGAPTADVGADGSVYLDTKSGTFWGPKAAGQWPTAPIGKLQHAPHVLPA
jgi:hypothetical protein